MSRYQASPQINQNLPMSPLSTLFTQPKWIHRSLVTTLMGIACLACTNSPVDPKGSPKTLPTLETVDIVQISISEVITGGLIQGNGGSAIFSKGVVWSTSSGPTIDLPSKTIDGSGDANFVSRITGLSSNTNYFVRAYATNEVGTNYGNQLTFQIKSLATIETAAVTQITIDGAISGGLIESSGGSPVSAKGAVWSTSPGPTISLPTKTMDGPGCCNFVSYLTGLNSNTTYFVRVYATNEVGTSYGNELSFVTGLYDLEGHRYETVQIGTQIWMAENLNTSKYRNGDPISNVGSQPEWEGLVSGAWCYYNNDLQFAEPYGRLYNWFAVTDLRKLCPAGWHVPIDQELTSLTDFLGGEGIAGGKVKVAGTSYWNPPNAGATNESGFNHYPNGYRGVGANFKNLGISGYVWSSTESGPNTALIRGAVFDVTIFFHYGNPSKRDGYSVRCLKD